MAQVRVLKIDSNGVPIEHAIADELTFTSFTVNGGGPVLSATGLDLNNQDVSDINDAVFNDPTTGTINQTAGNLIIDNIMAKERDNVMTVAGSVLFPVVTDLGGQLDAFRVPVIAGVPTVAPTTSGEGYVVFDSVNDDLYIWNGSSWDSQSIVEVANNIDDTYIAEEALAIRNAVYISSADNVSKADISSTTTAQLIGFATAAASATASVNIRKSGLLSGFTGLTAGARQYLSTAGAITETIPVGAGNTILQAGFAKNTTTLDIQIQFLGRRAV